jgi:hypothetical protein
MLDVVDKNGETQRAHLEAALVRARDEKRRAQLARALEGPECPESLEYLYGLAHELDRTRWTPDGPLPFTHAMIDSMARLTQRELLPLEVEGLLQLDHAMRTPATGEEDE